MGILAEVLLYVLTESLSVVGGRVARAFWINYAVGDRFEQRVGDTPIRQSRIVEVDDDHDTQRITVEWDDGTRTTGRPETVLHGTYRIHPLAPRVRS